MESLWQVEYIQIELITAGLLVVLAAILGWLIQRTTGGNGIGGAVILGLAALFASSFCIIGTILGGTYIETDGPLSGALIGLLGGMFLAGLVVPLALGRIIQGRSARFMAAQWFSFCALCLIGYSAGGAWGLITITLLCLVMFWVVLSRIARYTLPLRGDDQRFTAFRCLLTHARNWSDRAGSHSAERRHEWPGRRDSHRYRCSAGVCARWRPHRVQHELWIRCA